jgi:acyl carrier protein
VTAKTILEELEQLALSIAEQSGTDLHNTPESVSDSLLNRGMDSLDFIDFLLAIEGKYGFRVSEEDIKQHELISTPKMAEFLQHVITRASA